jgi:hypothetical protein
MAAQEKEQAGHLRSAKDSLVVCARATCGKAIAQECTSRFSRLESVDIPSIVPHVTDEKGAQRTDVKVGMDGELLTSRLDGQPILLDPGLHELSFIADGGLFAKEKVLVAEGQRGRVVEVSLKQGDAKELEKEVEQEQAAADASAATASATMNPKAGAAKGAGKAPASAPFVPSPNTPRGPAACMELYENAEKEEQAGHLREARGLLIGCARAACGHPLLAACSSKFTQLDAVDVPSIRPAVTDETGAARTDVQVRMDGELLAARLDGQALPVDPGLHEFTFETEGGLSSTQKILIVQGELGREVAVTLRGANGEVATTAPAPPTGAPREGSSPPVDAEPERPTSKRSALPYLIGGGIFAVVEAGAAVLYLGQADNSHLAVDVSIGASIGVGAAALGVATWLLLSDHKPHDEKAASSSAYVFGVSPTPSGAVAAVSGRF